MEHFVIIDGHHLMYRAFYAIPRTLKTTRGEQTNAVFGVASMLLTMLRTEQPDRLLFCFDAGDQTFRHQENETYKDGRAETPDEFYLQIPRILELIAAFNLGHVSDVRFEADDFLCTYARAAEREGMRVTIVTGDRDAFQLASDKITIAIPHKGYQKPEYLTPLAIETKYGVRPDQIASYKGLTGDTSDNLAGVKGIGPKTAAILLQQYGSLTGIYEHLADIKSTMREKLERDREQAFFTERMATLVCDIDLPIPLENLQLKDMPVQAVREFFGQMEFSILLNRFESFVGSEYGKKVFRSDEIGKPIEKVIEKKSQMTLF